MVEHSLIVRDNDILGGMPVFAGTRVPVRTLLDYLKAGQPPDAVLGPVGDPRLGVVAIDSVAVGLNAFANRKTIVE